MTADKFTIKDSGARAEFASGMVRDTEEGKIMWSLIADGPMLRRFAVHLTNGAKKYNPRNWMKASGRAELRRFKDSAYRHFMQWYYGEEDEDHAAAVWFNVNGAEYVKERLARSGGPGHWPLPPDQQNLHVVKDSDSMADEDSHLLG